MVIPFTPKIHSTPAGVNSLETVSRVGWGLLPAANELFLDAWPILSCEENELVHRILEAFYLLPAEKQTDEDLVQLLSTYCDTHHIHLDSDQRTYILSILHQHAREAGPLTPLLHYPALEEIAITGIGREHPVRVYLVERGWTTTPLFFSDETFLVTLLNRLALSSGKRLSAHTPILNAQLLGNFRLHASIFPVCPSRVEASIRRYVVRATRPGHLLSTSVISPDALAYVVSAFQSDCNVLIVGNTGSGKTTTLNALLGCLPPRERIILVEETPELNVTHEHVVRLTPSASEHASLSALIRETLRMRPDRVVVGEIRFPEEARAFLESVLAGQGKGTYATFHGHSSAEALSRMRQFGLVESDLGWINVVLVQRRWSERRASGELVDRRAVCEIVELVRSEENGHSTWNSRVIFAWDTNQQILVGKNDSVLVREKFSWCFPRDEWAVHVKKMAEEFHSVLQQSSLPRAKKTHLKTRTTRAG
jgi:Flp pilus assembly CpaF family ATPase